MNDFANPRFGLSILAAVLVAASVTFAQDKPPAGKVAGRPG